MLQTTNIAEGSRKEGLAEGPAAFRTATGRRVARLGRVRALLLALCMAIVGTSVAAQEATGPWMGAFSKDSRVVVTPEGLER
jgi:hypothetical protein